MSLDENLANLDIFERQDIVVKDGIEEIVKDLEKNKFLHHQASVSHLNSRIFRAMVDAQVLVSDPDTSSENVEKFYLDNRAMLEHSQTDFYMPVLPAIEPNELEIYPPESSEM